MFAIAALLGAIGQFLYKSGADRAGGTVASYLLNARLLGGVVCYVAVMVLFVAAFKKGGALRPLPRVCEHLQLGGAHRLAGVRRSNPPYSSHRYDVTRGGYVPHGSELTTPEATKLERSRIEVAKREMPTQPERGLDWHQLNGRRLDGGLAPHESLPQHGGVVPPLSAGSGSPRVAQAYHRARHCREAKVCWSPVGASCCSGRKHRTQETFRRRQEVRVMIS